MAEVEEECIFHTQTNGDDIRIRNLSLSQAQATSLAWLVNADGNVELEFKVKVKK